MNEQPEPSEQPAPPAAGPAPRSAPDLTHLTADGAVHMVDIGAKPVTDRSATATALVRTTAEVVRLLTAGELPKGEALAVARVAGIQAAKQTSQLIPLCHPLPLSGVTIELEPVADTVQITASVRTTGRTGVEMEALTAASVAALTVYDMIKGVDRAAVIETVQVVAKAGGRSGEWRRA